LNLSTLVLYAQQSDGVLYIMAVLLVVVLAVIVDRSISLRSTIRAGGAMVRRVAMTPTLDRGQLAALAREAGRLPEAQLLSMAAQALAAWIRSGSASASTRRSC
jgi:outer membrane transport energization protein ExbB (TC 2.C.1.1.1)